MTAAGAVLMRFAAAPLLPRTGDDPPVTISRDPAREAAEREVSKPMYHEHDPSLLQRALNAFWDWVDDLFSAAAGATPGGGFGLLVIILAVVLLGVALWWRLGTPQRIPRSAPALFDDRPRSAAEHRAASEAHAARAHWNQAVQERMRASAAPWRTRTPRPPPRPHRRRSRGRGGPDPPRPHRSTPRRRPRVRRRHIRGRTADESAYLRLAELDRDLDRTKPLLTNTAQTTPSSNHQGAAK